MKNGSGAMWLNTIYVPYWFYCSLVEAMALPIEILRVLELFSPSADLVAYNSSRHSFSTPNTISTYVHTASMHSEGKRLAEDTRSTLFKITNYKLLCTTSFVH